MCARISKSVYYLEILLPKAELLLYSYIAMATATLPRCDIQVTGCESDDERLYSELDDKFYGFNFGDVETLSIASTAVVEDSDEEDVCIDDGFDVATAISRANCSEVNDPSYLLPAIPKFESGCGCPNDCYKQFSEEQVYQSCLQIGKLEEGKCDLLIIGKLMVCGCTADSVSHAHAVTATKTRRIIYEYSYDRQVVCKSVLCLIGKKVFKNLQSHLKSNVPIPRLSSYAFSLQTTKHVADLLHFKLCCDLCFTTTCCW